MQNKTETKNDPPVPLPPPPPPPSPSQTKLSSKNIEIGMTPTTTGEEFKNDHLYRRILRYLFKDIHTNIVSFVKHLVPVKQDGPCCGIVALSMASQLCKKNVSPDELLSMAKESNFTKMGEMFSVYNMAKLATALVDCEAVVVSNLLQHKNDIMRNLANGWPVLIPYDADKNHEPHLNNGRNAHWAVLCGLCFRVSMKEAYSFLDGHPTVDFLPCFYNLSCSSIVQELLNFAEKFCVYAYQGKSKRLTVFDFDSLLQSNSNLFEVTNKYNLEDMIIPSAGMLELNDKAIILKPKIE